MITERQIKSRFQKKHIVKLINELLLETLTIKDRFEFRYVLNPSVTVDSFAESIRMGEIKTLEYGILNQGLATLELLGIPVQYFDGSRWLTAFTVPYNGPSNSLSKSTIGTQGIPSMLNLSDEERLDFFIKIAISEMNLFITDKLK